MLCFRLQHIYFVALYGLFFPDPKSRNEEIMAFDGVTIACVISELKKELIGGRLYKIAQPENDELLLTIKQPTGQKRLLLSASASLRQRFPAPDLSDGEQQTQSHDGPQLLYAAAQALTERPYREHFPAGAGAYRAYRY